MYGLRRSFIATVTSIWVCAFSGSAAHALMTEGVEPLVVECHAAYDLDNFDDEEALCGSEAVLLGTYPDLNNSGFVAFTDATGVYRLDTQSGFMEVVALTGQSSLSCTPQTERMNGPGEVARINEDGLVAWTAPTCLWEPVPARPACPECSDSGGDTQMCGLSQDHAAFSGAPGGWEQLTDGKLYLYESEIELMESGAVAAALFAHQRCDDEVDDWSLALLSPGGNTTLLNFDGPAPLPNTQYGTATEQGVDKHSSFLSLSPGEELPALMHATAHRSDEVNYTMLVDLEEPMPHEVEFFCGATLFDGGPGGGPGAGGAFKRGESKLAKSKRGQNKLGKGKRSQSKRFRPQTVYTPRANDNKPDLGCVVCDAPAPWAVLFANRTVTQTPELPSCTEGDPVLLQLDPSDQHPPIELLELGVTPVVGFGPEVIVFGVHHSPATAANGIAVFVGVYGEPGEWAKQAILAVTAPGVVEVVLSEDDAVEGLEGYAYEAFGPPTINTSHQLVFHADVTSADQPAKAGIFSAWLAQEVTCPADFNGDGEVDGADLGLFLVEWGPCEGCQGDFNGDGHVDGADLGLFLVEWGPCAP